MSSFFFSKLVHDDDDHNDDHDDDSVEYKFTLAFAEDDNDVDDDVHSID